MFIVFPYKHSFVLQKDGYQIEKGYRKEGEERYESK